MECDGNVLLLTLPPPWPSPRGCATPRGGGTALFFFFCTMAGIRQGEGTLLWNMNAGSRLGIWYSHSKGKPIHCGWACGPEPGDQDGPQLCRCVSAPREHPAQPASSSLPKYPFALVLEPVHCQWPGNCTISRLPERVVLFSIDPNRMYFVIKIAVFCNLICLNLSQVYILRKSGRILVQNCFFFHACQAWSCDM
jgi:hypothetical protein